MSLRSTLREGTAVDPVLRAASVVAFVLLLLALVCHLAFAAGCKGIEVQVCYVHPVYGQVCVSYEGKLYIKADVSDEARKEIVEWIKSKGGGSP